MAYVFQIPFTCTVYGSTGTGKTEVVHRFLQHQQEMTSTNGFDSIYYFYGVYQPRFSLPKPDGLNNLKYIEGFPNEDFFEKDDVSNPYLPTLLILDDLLIEASTKPIMAKLFMQLSHHLNISVMFMTNNLFYPSTYLRTAMRNTQIFLIQVCQRDTNVISILSRQLFPGTNTSRQLLDAFKASLQSNSSCYNTLLVDLFPFTDNKMRILENFFPQKPTNLNNSTSFLVAYVPKKLL